VSIKRAYTNGLSAALVDLFSHAQVAVILENSFNAFFLQEKYPTEQALKDHLFKLVLSEANKIRNSEVTARQLAALSASYDFFWEHPVRLRSAIALTDAIENYPPALEALNNYMNYLEEVKDTLRAKIVEGIHSSCENKYLELTNSRSLKGAVNPINY
jgi:hypothetical protein